MSFFLWGRIAVHGRDIEHNPLAWPEKIAESAVDPPLVCLQFSVMPKALLIDPRDNLAVALQNIPAGETVDLGGDKSVVALEQIPAKQKVATENFASGHRAVQYGVTVGRSSGPISKGGLVTTENLDFSVEEFSVPDGETWVTPQWTAPDTGLWAKATFSGYRRDDGLAGTANYWIVIPLVFCETRNIEAMKSAFERGLGYRKTSHYEDLVRDLAKNFSDGKSTEALREITCPQTGETGERSGLFPNVDGIKFLNHQMGCGGTRDDSQTLCGLLAGYITHPNVAGATVLSLGCEIAQAKALQKEILDRSPKFSKPLYVFTQQKFPSERELVSTAIRETFIGMTEANQLQREELPLSKLILGTECGGSDGFSGISANPVIGRVSDLVTALGGAVILSEFPELCGVEQELISRCVTSDIAMRFAEITKRYAKRAEEAGSHFSENPSPGNIRDGLITDGIKSAGAAKKGGSSPVTDVLDYPGVVTRPGLNLLCTPGNDVESTTGLGGAHANVILFSTGLGTPTGNPVCPVIKISSNTALAKRMSDVIDFDAGGIIDGSAGIEALGDKLLAKVIEVASGRVSTKAQLLGQDDFIPWKRGVSL